MSRALKQRVFRGALGLGLTLAPLAPVSAWALCEPAYRYRELQRTPLSTLLALLDGGLGLALMVVLAVMSAAGLALAGAKRDERHFQRGVLLAVLAGLIFVTRLWAHYAYFCGEGSFRQGLARAFETGGSILLGALLIGLPCLLIGAYGLRLIQEAVLQPVRQAFREGRLSPGALRFLGQLALGLALMFCLASFSWSDALPAVICVVLGALGSRCLWPEPTPPGGAAEAPAAASGASGAAYALLALTIGAALLMIDLMGR